MSFIKKNLAQGEEVIVTAHVSWFSQYHLITLCAIVYIFGISIPNGFIIAMCGVGFLVKALINIYSTELALTNRRIIAKTGIIRRNTVEIKATRIESLGVDQSVLGRILNFGSITIGGVGGSDAPIRNISAPLEFRQKVYNYVDNLKSPEPVK